RHRSIKFHPSVKSSTLRLIYHHVLVLARQYGAHMPPVGEASVLRGIDPFFQKRQFKTNSLCNILAGIHTRDALYLWKLAKGRDRHWLQSWFWINVLRLTFHISIALISIRSVMITRLDLNVNDRMRIHLVFALSQGSASHP